ncbi:type VI secretion protein [Streptomyces bauhiniae]|uniref:Type VI secretion protein n=1 Tax=Streptomyces bauhiniae TaxID=2340725 RepID=A0A4Z1CYM1_9ACTN|nr:type VI secretion protein [Streptomyces bauhiniae]TGN74043.1 type VI secretion protein [Streptomyces bauhiniae]
MRADERRDAGRAGEGGGIPDGLLVGLLAFLLGMTVLVWTATGLAALFARGTWPAPLAFTRTPLAIRHLVAQPHDIAGAWAGTPPDRLPGWGLFWGLFIGQLLILLVLTVFVLGTVARWRAGRVRRLAGPPEAPVAEKAVPEPRIEQPVFAAPPPVVMEKPQPAVEQPPPVVEQPQGPLRYGTPEIRHASALTALQDAPGPALVVTSDPALWQETKDARAKLGPVLLYDPTHRCDTPARLHWSPTAGCEDRPTALSRATALLAPVRPTARIDQAVTDTATTLLRSFLHAAALDGRTIRHVHRWTQGTQLQDAVRTLRTHPKAAPGSAGELEAALTSYPERRDIAQELTGRALSALLTVNIRESCTPHRTDTLALDSFVHEGGTLYVVGEPIEDPRTRPGAMPLLTALVSSVVEHGRRMAERSSSGRLDPPLTLILDDVAAVAPLPQLPELLGTGPAEGLPTLALLRSREQARARWPHEDLPV